MCMEEQSLEMRLVELATICHRGGASGNILALTGCRSILMGQQESLASAGMLQAIKLEV